MLGAHSSALPWSLRMLAAILLIAMQASPQAQDLNAHPTEADLSIWVKLENEQIPTVPVQVQLLKLGGILVSQRFTNAEGRAEFPSVWEGTYQVKVGGNEYVQFTSAPFTILKHQRTHLEIMHVTIKTEPGEKPNKLISAGELQIPEKARNLLQKAAQQFDKGAADEAMQSLRSAIAIYPRYAQAYNNLGVVLISKDDAPGAMEAFQNALKADEKFVPALVNVARLQVRLHDLPKAQTSLQNALTNEPLNAEALTLLANVQFYQGHYAEAVAAVNRLHAAPHEGFADAHLVAAEALQKTGNNQQAIEQCQMFLKESPNSQRAEQVRNAIKVLAARN